MSNIYDGKKFFENLTLNQYADLHQKSYDKQMEWEQILYEMLYMLPSSYNKDVQDTNYYKLFRALALELSDVAIKIQEIQKNAVLNTASGNFIYDNFGSLVRLRRREEWDDEKYRGLVKGVIKSLIAGPTKESMISAFKSFFNFKANVYELFKDKNLPFDIPDGVNKKFTFIVEMEIPVELMYDELNISKDSEYLINIVKPAHTLSILFRTYVAEENYSKHYSVDKKIHQWTNECLDLKVKEYINNLIKNTFEAEKAISGKSEDEFSNTVRGMTNAKYLENIYDGGNDSSVNPIQSAKYNYLQYLKSINPCDVLIYPIPNAILIEIKNDFNNIKSIDSFFNTNFKTFDSIIESLSSDFVGASNVNDEVKEYFLEKLNPFVVKATYDNMTGYEKNILQNLEQEAFNQTYVLEEEMITIKKQIMTDLNLSVAQALNKMKKDALYERVLLSLGGFIHVYQNCLQEKEKWRASLEEQQIKTPYCGMDEMVVDIEDVPMEGIFGWKSIGYPLQLMTSLNKNEHKIGGATLIGPIYAIDEEVYAEMEEVDGTKVIRSLF
jgi:hypothetical protein